ncbi:phage tail protein [Veronia nyctiphanis]|uniref:Phage tail protein n=1 Tax=Veronia nyctiphanis TaxID=1278244 RepID=A0A4Q0YIW2_9GAMM|nr:tail protein X [Veronia nyctiphanis]RXJ70642.1 phage tail protein [Veronia nyctiphanis]
MKVLTQQGDTLDLVCWRYFNTTAGITEEVLSLNPHIEQNSPFIPHGTAVELPEYHAPIKPTIHLWD